MALTKVSSALFEGDSPTFTELATLTGTTPQLDFKQTSGAHILASVRAEVDSGTGGKLVISTKRDGDSAVDRLTIDDDGASTFSGSVTATSLDISGNIDVDGTTNLDVVDIDGAVDMASTLTVATKVFTPFIGSASDTDTNIYFPASNQMRVLNGGVEIFRTLSTGAVFNEGSVDLDFRVESNGNANMFYIDGGNDAAFFGGSDKRGFVNIETTAVNYSSGVFDSPHIALQASSQPDDNDGFVGITFATSDSDNYGWSAGAERTSSGVGDFVFTEHNNSATGSEKLRLTRSGAATFSSTIAATGATIAGTTNDGSTLTQITQSGTGRGLGVNRNVASATRAMVNLVQNHASGGTEAVLDIQQTLSSSRAIRVTADGTTDRFSVYGTGALVTTPPAGGHAVFNENGVDVDFRVESNGNANMLFVDGGNNNVLLGKASLNIGVAGVEFRGASSNYFTTSGDTVLGLNRLSTDGPILEVRKDSSIIGNLAVSSGAYLSVRSNGGNLRLGANNTDYWSIDEYRIYPVNDAVDDIGLANNRVKDLYLSGGVYLGGTGAANKLDDYEEGTWTPNTGGGGVTWLYQSGVYTKVGRLVTVTFWLQAGSTDSTSGGVSIVGLPFATNSVGRNTAAIRAYNLANFSGNDGLIGWTSGNATSVTINATQAGLTSGTAVNKNVWRHGAELHFSLTYMTA